MNKLDSFVLERKTHKIDGHCPEERRHSTIDPVRPGSAREVSYPVWFLAGLGPIIGFCHHLVIVVVADSEGRNSRSLQVKTLIAGMCAWRGEN